jgi:hypothetical protein
MIKPEHIDFALPRLDRRRPLARSPAPPLAVI